LESTHSFIDASVVGPLHLTNRSSQPLAVPMINFRVISTLNDAAKLAAASGG
jgi:hypothetical protein